MFEIDARAVYNLIIKPKRYMNHHEPLVRQIHQMMKREWKIEFRHTYREGNKGADFLCRKSLMAALGFHFVDLPSAELRNIVLDDARGAVLPRTISIM
ncbi:hypothetical protein AHAS_Ahas05G0152100 [Arachis hypogaea]